MRQFCKIILLLIFIIIGSCARHGIYREGYDYRQGNPSVQIFYDQLSPYGQWTAYRDYGYVWIPQADRNFFPYSTRGHWVMTDYGWTWLSDYPWGWAAFHYGRWDYDNYLGWFWVPGDEWGPSWVTWRRADGYYGWSPMRPGMNINQSITGGSRDLDRWVFVRERDFGKPEMQRRYVSRRSNENIFRNSTIINNTYIDNNRNVMYVSGPRVEDVQRATGRRINRLTVEDNVSPGERRVNNSRLQIYRPQIRQSNAMGDRAAPARVVEPEEIRSREERSPVNRRVDQRREEPEEIRQEHQEKREQSKEREVRRRSERQQERVNPRNEPRSNSVNSDSVKIMRQKQSRSDRDQNKPGRY
jgi:hypothetical protein